MVVSSPTFPVQVVLGIYLGILTGIIPAIVAWALAFLFKYVTGLTVPSFAIVVLGVAIAGINGGFLAFNDPTILQSSNSITIVTAILVVMLMAFYTHNMGDKLGTSMPRRLSFQGLRQRTLARDVVELVEGRNRVRLTVVGAIEDMEGYPSLPSDLRGEIRSSVEEWSFPADQPLPELEAAVADRLRTELELSAAQVVVDERARATVTAAPPLSGLSKEIPPGRRAVTVEGLVPTGLAPGDTVRLLALPPPGEPSEGFGVEPVEGTVLGMALEAADTDPAEPAIEPDAPAADPAPIAGCQGGEGRVTVAVSRSNASRMVPVDRWAVVVASSGTRREFELLSLLRRSGQRIRRLTVRADGPLDGVTIGAANVRDGYGVVVLAVRHDGTWRIVPRGETAIAAGDELFAAGPRESLTSFVEAVA